MKMRRSFLKWAGGKFDLLDVLKERLPSGDRLVEPFVGSGTVFLNMEYREFLLSDVNPDLINLYNLVKTNPDAVVAAAKFLFSPDNNTKSAYNALRIEFNSTTEPLARSALFIYLNRFGYNGLCRYNLSGGFNVPFGQYQKPRFPEDEIYYFSERAQKAVFRCQSFTETFAQTRPGDVCYCDPPYVPLSPTANFSSYAKESFGLVAQKVLSQLAESCSRLGTDVLISNHDTSVTRNLYSAADLHFLSVARNISCASENRKAAPELIAHFKGKKTRRSGFD